MEINKLINGKIYTIKNRNDDTLVYVGSTAQTLYKRFSNHKTRSKNSKYENMKLYKKMKETNINDWYIELYEDFNYERKEQLLQREGQIIKEIGTLNKNIPITPEERDRYHEEYYLNNNDNYKEYYLNNKDNYKEYYKVNKDKLKEYQKEYYKNKKKLSQGI